MALPIHQLVRLLHDSIPRCHSQATLADAQRCLADAQRCMKDADWQNCANRATEGLHHIYGNGYRAVIAGRDGSRVS